MAEAVIGNSIKNSLANSPLQKGFSVINSPEGILDADLTLEASGAARGLAGGGAASLQQAGAGLPQTIQPTAGFGGGFQLFGGTSAGASRGQDAVDQLLSGLGNDVAGFGGPK